MTNYAEIDRSLSALVIRISFVIRSEKCHDRGNDENIHQRDLEKENPAQPHQLIVTKTRQRPADPDEEKEQRADFREKDEDIESAPKPSSRAIHRGILREEMPAAEEQGHDDGRAGDHGRVFAEEKKREFHRAIFGVVTAGEFLSRLRVDRTAGGWSRRKSRS